MRMERLSAWTVRQLVIDYPRTAQICLTRMLRLHGGYAQNRTTAAVGDGCPMLQPIEQEVR
jgi:hypothetical protein